MIEKLHHCEIKWFLFYSYLQIKYNVYDAALYLNPHAIDGSHLITCQERVILFLSIFKSITYHFV